MSRAGRITDNTPICVECGRGKTRTDGPWMQHPIDYGWWCGCEPCDHYFAANPGMYDSAVRYCERCGVAER